MRRGLRMVVWLVLLALPFAAAAQDYPSPGSDTVNDWAEVLPPEAEARIAATLRAARQETGVQVVLVTMARIADHGGAGQRLESYAKGLFNAWGVGDGQRNDGILVLVATEDRAMRIALGAGYDPVWDNAAQAAIDRGFLPDFRTGRMAAGIETGMGEVIARIARPFAAGQPAPAPQEEWPEWLMFPVVAGAALLIGLRRRLGDLTWRLRRCPVCGHRGLHRSRSVLVEASESQTGRGEIVTRCPACNDSRREDWVLPVRSRDNDSSSGGFGGGRSSGGGASGRW